MINENKKFNSEDKEKRDLAEATITQNGLDGKVSIDKGVELFDDVFDAIVADEHAVYPRIMEYKNPRTQKVEKKLIHVKIIPNNGMIQKRRHLKKKDQSDYMEQEIVKKYWVDENGVNYPDLKVESLPDGVITKIYKIIKDISNIDDSEEMKMIAKGFAGSS
jgi:hypothetical protein